MVEKITHKIAEHILLESKIHNCECENVFHYKQIVLDWIENDIPIFVAIKWIKDLAEVTCECG